MFKNKKKNKYIALVLLVLFVSSSAGSYFFDKIVKNSVEQVFSAPEIISSSFLTDNGEALLGLRDGRIICFNGNQIKWTFQASNMISSISTDSDGNVYAGSEDRNLYVISNAGKIIKQYSIKDRIFKATGSYKSGITILAGIGRTNYYIKKINPDGSDLWTYKLGYDSKAFASNREGTALFYGTRNAILGCLDNNGNIVWETSTSFPIKNIVFLEDGKKVFVSLENGTIKCFSDSGEHLYDIISSNNNIRALAVSEKPESIASGDEFGFVSIYDGKGSRLYQQHFSDNDNRDIPICDLGFNSSNKLLISTVGTEAIVIDGNKVLKSTVYRRMSTVFFVLALVLLLLSAVLFVIINTYLYGKLCKVVREIKKGRSAYIMLLPGFLLMIVFMYYPIFKSFYMSLMEWSLSNYSRPRFIGLTNYFKMFSGNDTYFWVGFGNMFKFMFFNILKVITVPVLIAELIFWLKSKEQKYFFRVAFVFPMVVPGLVTTLMWRNIYDPNIGLVNMLLKSIGLGNLAQTWLGDGNTVIGALIFMGFPWVDAFALLLYIGALMNIPTEIFDSAQIDGCKSKWKRFWYIDIPYISNQLKVMVILYFINAIKEFAGIYLMTEGGPGHASYVPSLELFFHMTRFNNYGYASALGVVLFILTMIGTLLNSKIRDMSDMKN